MSILLELDVTDDDPALTDSAALGAHAVGPRAVALYLHRAAVLALERRHPHNRPLTSSGSKHKQSLRRNVRIRTSAILKCSQSVICDSAAPRRHGSIMLGLLCHVSCTLARVSPCHYMQQCHSNLYCQQIETPLIKPITSHFQHFTPALNVMMKYLKDDQNSKLHRQQQRS